MAKASAYATTFNAQLPRLNAQLSPVEVLGRWTLSVGRLSPPPFHLLPDFVQFRQIRLTELFSTRL